MQRGLFGVHNPFTTKCLNCGTRVAEQSF